MVGLPRNYKLKETDQSRKGGKDCYALENTAYGCSAIYLSWGCFRYSLMHVIKNHKESITEERALRLRLCWKLCNATHTATVSN